MKKISILLVMILLVSAASAKRKAVYCFFQTGTSSYEDSLIRANIVFRGDIVDLEIYNKTDQVIFVDKGSSFAYKNKAPVCLFQNSSHTTGKTTGGGASINLGSITGALGIGGIAGTLANGVNVGGGKAAQNSTTTYEQRVLAIAPQATYEIYRWGLHKEDITYYIDNSQSEGKIFDFKKEFSPCVLKAVITYSASEDFQKANQTTIDAYVSTMVVDSHKGLYGLDLNKTAYCSKFRHLPFFAYKL